MSWVHVQGNSGVATSLAFGSAVTAGNLIVVSIAEYNGASTAMSCKDSKNNVFYTPVAQPNNGGIQLAVLWYIPPVGGTSFTITNYNTYYSSMTIDEYSIPAGSSGLVVDSFGSDNTGAKTLASSLTVTGTDLIYAAGATGSGTLTAGSGFNQRGQVAYVYAVDEGITSEDQLNVTSNINPSWSNYPTAMIGVAFKPLLPFTFNATGLAISGVFGVAGAGLSSDAAGMAISGSGGGTGATLFAPLGGLTFSGVFGGAGAGLSSGVAGMSISGVSGGTSSSILTPLGGLTISGYPGTGTAGPAPGVAGMAVSGTPGVAAFPGIISPLAGLAISGHPGTGTAGPAPGVTGLAISGVPGGNPALTVTVSISGLTITGYPAGAVGGEYLGPFYLPYEYTSVPIETGNANPFGIDPERTTIITVGLTGAE